MKKGTTKAHGRPRTTTRRAARPPALLGPAGGEWRLTDSGEHGAPNYCSTCQTTAVRPAWTYFVGLTGRLTICVECVEGLVEK